MVIFNNKKRYNLSMLHSMTIRLIYVHLLEPFNLCQMPTKGDLGPNLDFQVNCNISFVIYYKIFRQDLCRSNDTTALVILPAQPQDLILLQFLLLLLLLLLSVNIAISPTAYMV